MKFSIIIVAAGQGTRAKSETPKQFIKIAGKTILEHTIDKFSAIKGIEKICVVLNENHSVILPKNIITCSGGATRKDSVYNGLKSLSDLADNDIILIHDAARPFVAANDIEKLLKAIEKCSAATLAAPVTDTLRHENQTIIDRENLWAIQTPQAFKYGIIKHGHENSDPDIQYTDDTSLVSSQGHNIEFVECGRHNFKITTPEDITMAKEILETYETRIGQGFDVHAFDETQADSIRLCGIDIPHDKRLKGHSDADVGLHTLTDAILGAIGEGDIGTHFPPSDNTFKNMDSAIFLERAMQLLREKGGELINADLTIICEAPKIGKHRAEIIKRMAEIMKVSENRLNIKATTTEQLGFTGRGEGIAAQASVSISMPKEI